MNNQTETTRLMCPVCKNPMSSYTCGVCTWRLQPDNKKEELTKRHIDPETYKEIHTAMEDLFLGNYKLAYDRLYKTIHTK